MFRYKNICFFILSAFSLSAGTCPPEPVEPEGLAPLGASLTCADDDLGPLWSFEFRVSGLVSSSGTRVHIETDQAPDPEGTPMTVAGSDETVTTFEGSVRGTADGESPAAGDLALSCAEIATASVRFCASPEGRPSEQPCWACGDGSELLPDEVEDWLDCD